MSDTKRPIALVGIGKIARDQHIPAIAASDDFELVAAVSRNAHVEGAANYDDLDAFLLHGPEDCAVSLCTPPSIRTEMTRKVLAAGRDVMIEKPPAATLGEVEALRRIADDAGRVLYASWHSRKAAGVRPAAEWLAGRTVRSVAIEWKEDVRRWHPGQDWVFKPGGFGVFDPGINALSILTVLIPGSIFVRSATLQTPSNRQTPIAARVSMRSDSVPIALDLDWRQEGPQTWSIEALTDEGSLRLEDGGASLLIDGERQPLEDRGEYPALYAEFAELLAERRSDVDLRPLRLVADAMLVGEHRQTDSFHFETC